MPRHVEFWNYSNAAVVCIRNHLAYLILRVVEPVRTHFLQFGEALALHAEALVFRKVPVKNIHLHRGHSIEIAFDDGDRHEVSTGVDHQSSPWKSRLIVD